MKLVFNILFILLLLIAFVPFFRRFLFHLLVGRQLVKQQDQQQQQQAATALEDSVAVQLQQAANNEAEVEGLKAQLRRRDATIKRLQVSIVWLLACHPAIDAHGKV